MKIIATILIISIGALIWMNQSAPNKPFTEQMLPAKELRAYMKRKISASDHPCLNRNKCLVLYLSPWCPSCNRTKNFVSYVREVIDTNEDTGFVVIVGKAWGGFKGGYEMARDIGGQVYIDADSHYWQQIRSEVNAIPAWLVFESDGDVSDTETGSPRRHDVTSAKTFLADLSIE